MPHHDPFELYSPEEALLLMKNGHAPSAYSIKTMSDYDPPHDRHRFVFCLCVLVLIVAVLALCACKWKSWGSDDNACRACTSARAASNQHGGGGDDDHHHNGDHHVTPARDAAHLDALLSADGDCVCIFWAPWCGHCKHAMPEFTQAATEHKHLATFVSCDCENAVGDATLREQGIEAFPTIRHYKHNQVVSHYEGPHSKDAMNDWIVRSVGSASD